MRWILALSLVLAGCQKHIKVTPTPIGSGRSVVMNWTASTTQGATYNAYRFTGTCAASNNTATKLNSSPITVLTYTDVDAPVGKLCYWATAYLQSSQIQESVPSNKVDLEIITQPQPPQNLQITPPTATVLINTQQQFTANLPDATWSISPADIGSISATGLYSAPSSIKGNNIQVDVVARSGSQTAVASVTIRKN